MIKKIMGIIGKLATNFGIFMTSTKSNCSSPNKLAEKTQRQLPRSMEKLVSKRKNVDKNVVAFNDPMTGLNYEVRSMLETGGDLHLIHADSRMASVLDSKGIKALAKVRGSKVVRYKDKSISSSLSVKKSFDKKQNNLSIVEKKSLTESLGGGKKHVVQSSNNVNVSLDEVSVSRNDSEVFKQKSRKNTITLTLTTSEKSSMSKAGVTIEKREEKSREHDSKSRYTLESKTIDHTECWDSTGYYQVSSCEMRMEDYNYRNGSTRISVSYNECSEGITNDGIITVSAEERSLDLYSNMYGSDHKVQWTLARSILDKNLLVVETDQGCVYTRTKKDETTTDFCNFKQSVFNTGITKLDWEFGHYTETKSVVEDSTFSANVCWGGNDDFDFELTMEYSIEDKRTGVAMSSISVIEGNGFEDFMHSYESFGAVATNVPRLGNATLLQKSHKN